MSLSRGAIRLYQAMKFIVAWPTHVKEAPFVAPQVVQIPVNENLNRTARTSPPWTINYPDLDSLTQRGEIPNAVPSYKTWYNLAPDKIQETESVKDSSTSTEEAQMVSLAIHEKALADKDAVEEAIRHELDPNGNISRLTLDTAGVLKWIKKRHRDALKDQQREKEATRIATENMKLELEGEIKDLNDTFTRQFRELQTKQAERPKISNDFHELNSMNTVLLAENEVKRNRITKLEEEAKMIRATCEKVTEDIVRETQEKVLNLENAKKKELADKEDKIKGLEIQSKHREQKIRDLENSANKDKDVFNKSMSDTQKSLRDAEAKIERQEREVKRLTQSRQEWESDSHTKSQEIEELKIQMKDLRVAQCKEIIVVEAKTEGLQATIDSLRTTNEELDQELELWKNRHDRGLMVEKSKNNGTLVGTEVGSLVDALKAANARANALQISTNAWQAENGVLRRQLENATNSYDPQVQEQVERLQNENQSLGDAAKKAEELKTQLKARFTEANQELEARFADRSRELETEFNQGFGHLCGLRDQWLQQKRDEEQQYYREKVAANTQHELERQGREDRFMAIWKEKDEDLQSREAELVGQAKNLYSSSQDLTNMKDRAERAEGEVDQLKERANQLQGEANQLRGEVNIRQGEVDQLRGEVNERQGEVEQLRENVKEFQEQVLDMEDYRDILEANLNNEIASQRRDGQRHLSLLNEETGRLDGASRAAFLHSELQIANCSLNIFKYQVTNNSTNSEALSQYVYGADFYDSDVHLLQDEGRPVLLAQLQAAKGTLDRLRSLVAGSPNVETDTAIAILTAPRGDEDAALPANDLFGESGEDFFRQSTEHQQPIQPPASRKRSEPPLGAPGYGDHEDNTAADDWGDLGVLNGARISTPEQISNRKRCQPKSRRNAGRAKTVPLEHIDPAIRDQ